MKKAFEIAGYDEEVLKEKFGALYTAGYFVRSAAHKVLSLAVHRECNDFSDIILISEKHNHSVNEGLTFRMMSLTKS